MDEFNQQHKIRLSGIDAPEKKQPFGQRSKEYLSGLVFDKPVTVEWKKKDRYQRIVGKVVVAEPSCTKSNCPKTLDAGLAQVTVGMAWWYRKYASEQTEEDRHRYEFAEVEARARKAGLWSDKDPVPPWEWRHRRTQQ
ncbi:thermonuclease family protein [Dechloromonas sp. H13]|uniref:thermonuclease family protein n=1 Tax=Dechloromonas sp. H13 TaxID=2570193 RepID=UPI001D187C5B|nr:thermonuclease family protein [Dechloromonas sp. H13]